MSSDQFTFSAGNGMAVRIRAEQPEDAPHLIDLFAHLSDTSRYLRFSKVMTDPDPERIRQEAERLASLGPPADMAWLAFADLEGEPGATVGGVRYVRTGDDSAELAISVRDDMQRQGIGTELLRYACDRAREEGLAHLTATFRSENKAVWSLTRHSPYPTTIKVRGPETTVTIDIQGDRRY